MTGRIAAVLIVAATTFGSTAQTVRRAYTFRCIEEREAGSRTLYSAEVEGPSDVDLHVQLHDSRHQIDVTFVNEPLPSGAIDSRIHLRSRRAWGLSTNGLPLWEEDDRRQRLRIASDEQIDLLPFGGRGEAGLLKIEITPATVARAAGNEAPIQIRIHQNAPEGAIEVSAFRSPHWYDVDLALVRNGATTARANGRLFADEQGTIALAGTDVHIAPGAVPYAGRWEFVSVRYESALATGAAIVESGRPITVPIRDQQQLVMTLRPEGESR